MPFSLLEADWQWMPNGVLARLPRTVVFGPMSGTWAATDALGGRLYVHNMFHADVESADAELGVTY